MYSLLGFIALLVIGSALATSGQSTDSSNDDSSSDDDSDRKVFLAERVNEAIRMNAIREQIQMDQTFHKNGTKKGADLLPYSFTDFTQKMASNYLVLAKSSIYLAESLFSSDQHMFDEAMLTAGNDTNRAVVAANNAVQAINNNLPAINQTKQNFITRWANWVQKLSSGMRGLMNGRTAIAQTLIPTETSTEFKQRAEQTLQNLMSSINQLRDSLNQTLQTFVANTETDTIISDIEIDVIGRASQALGREYEAVRQQIDHTFGSCSLHTKCGSCLKPNMMDPLRCGWCDSYCATVAECQTSTLFSQFRCPPEVFEFWPKSGPLSGGTRITIQGENLGEYQPILQDRDNLASIMIGQSGPKCVVEWREERLIKCRTEESPTQLSANLFVSVLGYYYISDKASDNNKTAISREEYKYLVPKLLGVYPSYGPLDGRTNVTLIGHNLNIGSKRRIFLAGIECKEVQNNSSFISCFTGSVGTAPSEDMSVRLNIDSEALIVNKNKTIFNKGNRSTAENDSVMASFPQWSEYFEYRPNPLIQAYYPNHTIKSGNTSITVKGVNLNSVAGPRLMVTFRAPITNKEVRSEGQCEVDSNGTLMICWTPPIDEVIQSPRSSYLVETQLSFVLDGTKNYHSGNFNVQKARLHYHPDPTYHNFQEKVREILIEEPILRIDGRELSSDYPIDITISHKYNVSCNTIEAKSSTELYCLVTYHEQMFRDDGEEHTVHIVVGRINLSPGRVKFVTKSKDLALGLVIILFLLIIICAGFVFYYRKRKDHKDIPLLTASKRYQVSEEMMNLLRSESILIDRKHILIMEQVLGEGAFGRVYIGKLHQQEIKEVALKTLKSSAIREEMNVESFLQESLIMKDFRHNNVMTLIGVSLEQSDGSPIVVLPFMKYGDLLSYIRDDQNNPTVKNLLMFSIDIAKGMDYLSTQKFVHRDLAARNCMLDSELCAKVADFGLSRDIYEKDYYTSENKKFKLPVKWMAPESLEKGTYNTKTDVWSYGVLVWELLTRGVTPYPDVNNWEILNYLNQGRRMPRPSFCPELLYYILLRCWSHDPRNRPTFFVLVKEVSELMAKLEKAADKQMVELDKCNTYVNYPVAKDYSCQQLSQSQTTCQESPKLTNTDPEVPANASAPTNETTGY